MARNLKKQESRRNWLDLPSEVTTNILSRIGIADILENAQLVCTAWHQICKDPVMYRVLNTNDLRRSRFISLENMCKQVVDRSQGQLVDITFVHVRNEQLLLYAAESSRSSQLRRFELVNCVEPRSFTWHALITFPLLEELNLYSVGISVYEIESLGRFCPLLKTFKMNKKVPRRWVPLTTSTPHNEWCLNAKAVAIAQNLPELRHLELIGNCMTNIGLEKILDNCHQLETLDLRSCFNTDIKGDLGEKCCKQIKNLKLPNDSLEGCPYSYALVDNESDDDDYFYCGPDNEGYDSNEEYELELLDYI
ncbi:hypothetical protein SSX86_018427 [Deinandra increscens subsp. villosa]|uniref:F-box domain-containing protein n=1 Tax=Deinandra increscens subsp. villosa TaxID=3103831 RepID=A0AAP0CW03_9ASTR